MATLASMLATRRIVEALISVRRFWGDVPLSYPTSKTPRGTLAISCIEPYVKAGIPPKIILRAMTTNAAQLLGVEKVRGGIQPGMAADIIATPDNPVDNIWTLKQVSFVMKDGKVFKAIQAAVSN